MMKVYCIVFFWNDWTAHQSIDMFENIIQLLKVNWIICSKLDKHNGMLKKKMWSDGIMKFITFGSPTTVVGHYEIIDV